MEAVGLHRKGEIDLQQIIDHIKTHPGYPDSGAIASFIGVVRGDADPVIQIPKSRA